MTQGEAANPHGDARVRRAGAPLHRAKAAVVMLHGRGADASDMLRLAEVLAQPNLTYLAPEAAGPELVSVFLSCPNRPQRAVPVIGLAHARSLVGWGQL